MKIVTTLSALLISVVIVDFGVGKLFDGLLEKLPSEGERVAKSNFVLSKVNSEIVIVGSSRAECHYNSKMLQDSILGGAVFNCGVDGALFFYEVAVVNSILDRYIPKMIIWDFQVDDLADDNKSESLGLLYPYYWRNDYIREFLDEREPELKYKIWLNAYRFNATGSRILRSLRIPETDNWGFRGQPVLDATRIFEFKTIEQPTKPIDPVKVKLLERTIKTSKEKGVELFVVISPYYNKFIGLSSTQIELQKVCSLYDIPFIDDSQIEAFIGKSEYIYDVGHLNVEGANVFTNLLINQLTQLGEFKRGLTGNL